MGSPTYDRAWGAFVEAVTRAHRVVHRATGGRIEIRLPKGGRGVWITTLGRRSGQWRRTPLLAIEDAQEPGVWIIAGSNGGQERVPGWVYNVQAHARGELEVARRSWPVRFVEVQGDERERCYAQLATTWPMYRSYERHAGRPIPVFRCLPITVDSALAQEAKGRVR